MAIAGIREASRLIFLDELTGLYNRRFMRQYLRERLDQLAQQRTPLCVIMLDLDGFKQINDTYGHMEGDLVLKRLAQLIGERLASSAYAIRFAGDEFFVFMEGVDGPGGIAIAEELRERVTAEPFVSPKAPAGMPIRISVGVAAFPEDAAHPSALIEAADQALYRSKRTGKNRVSRAGGWQLPPEIEVLKRFPCPRLVGRAAALGELERVLAEPNAKGNRFVLVEGVRGLGKTRLLAELLEQTRRAGYESFFQRCLEPNRAIPYSTLVAVVTEGFTRQPERLAAAKAQLSRPTVLELGTVIPELATPEKRREPVAPEDRRSLLFHGMGDLLRLLSHDAPLLLFLDDLQFLDEASLELLYRLLDREDGRVIVYAGAQSEALAQHPFPRLFDLLPQSQNFRKVILPVLTPSDVTQMVDEILGQPSTSQDFFERLYRASQGIPLFVEETLKGLITKGALKTVEGAWDLDNVEAAAIPASLEAAVLGGLEALDEEIHAMISKAAVVGPHVDLTLLADVIGKDPGETQHLVDKGKQHRVFEEPGPLADEEEVRFLSQCFQSIVYSHIDYGSRRQTHRVVGEVAERLAGPGVERVLGPLAYHFERSDNSEKAEFYRRRVEEVQGQLFSAEEIARELDLQVEAGETVPPLDERTWPFADRFLRALTVAVKNMRVFPAGSQIVAQGVAAVKARLLELLDRVETATFAEESQVLQINGEPVESIGLAPVAQDLLRIYADHGIRRCTFDRGTTATEMMSLLTILSGPPEGVQQDVAYWEKRLQTAGISHIRVFPVIFLAAGAGKAAYRREDKEARLDDPTLAQVRDTLRALATSVDNIRLYPPESELISVALDQLERQAQALFTRVPVLTVAMTEGTIVINATRPNPRLFGITLEILQRLMEDSGLTSLTIRRGVTRNELRAFLTHLAQPSEEAERGSGFWRDMLERAAITTIEVGTRTYAAAARLDEVEVEGPAAPAAPTPSEAERAIQLASQWLAEPLGAFLEQGLQERIPGLVGILRRVEREDLARHLVERTTAALTESDGGLRRKACAGVGLCLAGVEEECIDWVRDLALPRLAEATRKETQLSVFQEAVRVGGSVLSRLLLTGDLNRAATLAEGLGRAGAGVHRPDQSSFDGVVRELVDTLTKDRAFEPVFAALTDADPARQEQGRLILARLGLAAEPVLVPLILEGKNGNLARVAATLLRAQGDLGVRGVLENLRRDGPVEQVCRIVAVLDTLAPALGSDFLFLLAHPEVEVRAEVARALTRLQRDRAVGFLAQGLSQSRPEVMLGALEGVRGLGAVELLESVTGLVEHPPNDQVRRMACMCLGGLKDARAVVPLLHVLGRRPRFFGLVKGLPEVIRATAARSLGELHMPGVGEGLELALKDPSKTVRSAARLALLKLQQHAEQSSQQ